MGEKLYQTASVKLLFNPSKVGQLYSAAYSYQIREVVPSPGTWLFT